MLTGKVITDQNTEEFHNIKYGLFPMSFNGCEIIAVYNALVLLGKTPDLLKVKSAFHTHHLCLLLGLFGSNVYGTHKVLSHFGLHSQKVTLNEIKEDGLYIISFWNSRPPFHGIHTVTTQISDGLATTYNLYTNAPISHLAPTQFAGQRTLRAYRIFEERR